MNSGIRSVSPAELVVAEPSAAVHVQRTARTLHRLTFRADIEGLRAVAILGVLLFHAFPTVIKGGFIGVDVFFVISGFLISSIIWDRLETGRFSVLDFYAHRALRLFPALILILSVCFLFGWFTLVSGEMRQLGKHIAAGAGFVENFTLWNEAGYFDLSSELKPLMHLWSLAIEEQFYLAFPLMMWLAWQSQFNTAVLIGLLCAVSFSLNIHDTAARADKSFFTPQTRFWELLVGAALTTVPLDAVLARKISAYRSGKRDLRHVLSATGLALIGGGFLGIEQTNAFPGWWALMPVAGAGLLIAAGPKAWVNRHFLASRPLRLIGLISYPLYLWHWPLLSFARILTGHVPAAEARAALLALSFLLAWGTYALVERPVRFGKRSSTTAAMLAIALAIVGYIGFNAFKRDGLPFRALNGLNAIYQTASLRAGQNLVEHECGIAEADKSMTDLCLQDRRKPIRSVVWGDSKAEAVYWGLVRSSSQGGWRLIGRIGCTPMSGAARISDAYGYPAEWCARANAIALASITADPDIKAVVIGTASRVLMQQTYAEPTRTLGSVRAAQIGMSQAIEVLQKAGKQVIFLVDNPTLPDPSECMPPRVTPFAILNRLIQNDPAPKCTLEYARHLAQTAPYRHSVEAIVARHDNLTVYNPERVLCDLRTGVCPIIANDHFLYSYTDHVSDYANTLIARDILALIH